MKYLFSSTGNKVWVEVEADDAAEAREKLSHGEWIEESLVIEYAKSAINHWTLEDGDYE